MSHRYAFIFNANVNYPGFIFEKYRGKKYCTFKLGIQTTCASHIKEQTITPALIFIEIMALDH